MRGFAGKLVSAAAALVVGAAALAAAIAGATPAHAAADDPGALEFSLDGVTWSQTLTKPIYAPDAKIVPGSETTGTFYVRNNLPEPAWLRVGLSRLIVPSFEFAIAMNMTTVSTTPGGAAGSTQNLGAGPVCLDFLEAAQPLGPMGIARIDATLWFRTTVTGTQAQTAGAAVSYIVELASAEAERPTGFMCDPAGRFAIGDPNAPDPDQGRGGLTGVVGRPGTSDTGPSRSGGGGGASANRGGGAGAPAEGWYATLTGGEVISTSVNEFGEYWNTVRRDEEYAILVLLGAAIAGALVRLTAERRWGPDQTAEGDA